MHPKFEHADAIFGDVLHMAHFPFLFRPGSRPAPLGGPWGPFASSWKIHGLILQRAVRHRTRGAV